MAIESIVGPVIGAVAAESLKFIVSTKTKSFAGLSQILKIFQRSTLRIPRSEEILSRWVAD